MTTKVQNQHGDLRMIKINEQKNVLEDNSNKSFQVVHHFC